MTQEQILEMAKAAGFDVAQWAINGGIEVVIYEEGPITEQLKRFAALVAANEREVCAKVADNELMNTNMLTSYPPKSSAAWNIAAAIRARGEK